MTQNILRIIYYWPIRCIALHWGCWFFLRSKRFDMVPERGGVRGVDFFKLETFIPLASFFFILTILSKCFCLHVKIDCISLNLCLFRLALMKLCSAFCISLNSSVSSSSHHSFWACRNFLWRIIFCSKCTPHRIDIYVDNAVINTVNLSLGCPRLLYHIYNAKDVFSCLRTWNKVTR